MGYAGIIVVCCISTSFSQVTNLNINHSGLSFSMVSGDTITWEYNVPTGATTSCEFWLDINHNGVIDPSSDILFFTFLQTDGDTTGNGGPPDMDGGANGHVIFSQRVGMVPGQYVLKFTQNGGSMTAIGTVTPLPSPAHYVSGTVTPPLGQSAKNILLQLERKNNLLEGIFWMALTDSTGYYAIPMNGDSAGSWNLHFQNNPFPGAVCTPSDTTITIVGNPSGLNFVFTAPSAKVAGYLKDDNNQPIPFQDVGLSRGDFAIHHEGMTDGTGFFEIGLLPGELNGQTWQLQSVCDCPNGATGSQMQSQVNLPAINSGDSLFRVLTIYSANSQITGRVTINGAPPSVPISIMAFNDTAQAGTMADSITGNFMLQVSDKISSYSVSPTGVFPPNYSVPNAQAHAGDTGVTLNFVVTSVIEKLPGLPTQYALHQNYPNPFNPSTSIRYDLPEKSIVTLKIYDLLGRQVITLVDGVQDAGFSVLRWNAAGFTSGVYFYRLQATSVNNHDRSFAQVRKLILIK